METSLHDLLTGFFQKQKSWKITLLSQFQEIVGTDLKEHVSILKINETSITIGVSNSCLLQELRMLTPILLNKLNQSLDISRLTSIQFKLRGLNQTGGILMHSNNNQEYSSVHATTLTENDRKALSIIKDQELAQALENFRKRCHREAQWKKK